MALFVNISKEVALMRFCRLVRVLFIILLILAINVGAFCFLADKINETAPQIIETIANVFKMTSADFVALCTKSYLLFFIGAGGLLVLIIFLSIIIGIKKRKNLNSSVPYNNSNYSYSKSSSSDDDERDPRAAINLAGPPLPTIEDLKEEYGDFFESLAKTICDALRTETPTLKCKVNYWYSKKSDYQFEVNFDFRLGMGDSKYSNSRAKSQLIELVKEGIRGKKFKYSIQCTVFLL